VYDGRRGSRGECETPRVNNEGGGEPKKPKNEGGIGTAKEEEAENACPSFTSKGKGGGEKSKK